MNPYESDIYLHEYLLFHYGTTEQILPAETGSRDSLDFPARCVSELLDPTPLAAQSRALDIGCAVGRASFELARHCPEVIALDFSARFIAAAQLLQHSGCHPVRIVQEGLTFTHDTVRVPETIDRTRVRFAEGDAMALPESLGAFDVVLAANLIDRLPDPDRFLQRLPSLLKPGGQLLLTSPYTWLESFTPREQWLGGTPETGSTFSALQRILEPAFTLTRRLNLPFLIREHARKFQWSIADATVWIKT